MIGNTTQRNGQIQYLDTLLYVRYIFFFLNEIELWMRFIHIEWYKIHALLKIKKIEINTVKYMYIISTPDMRLVSDHIISSVSQQYIPHSHHACTSMCLSIFIYTKRVVSRYIYITRVVYQQIQHMCLCTFIPHVPYISMCHTCASAYSYHRVMYQNIYIMKTCCFWAHLYHTCRVSAHLYHMCHVSTH
jgi:hypothetical protein